MHTAWIMTPALTRASRYISWALRHSPEEANIVLDKHGWTSVQKLLRSVRRQGHDVSADTLRLIVAYDAKGRYSLSHDGKMIRANYGHSVSVLPDAPAIPPTILYHGTSRQNLTAIKEEGLSRQARRFVHLTRDIHTAFNVGRRHGPPVVIVVDAAAMHADGATFYAMTSEIWLTESVPATYLNFDALIFDAGGSHLSASDAESRASDPHPTS